MKSIIILLLLVVSLTSINSQELVVKKGKRERLINLSLEHNIRARKSLDKMDLIFYTGKFIEINRDSVVILCSNKTIRDSVSFARTITGFNYNEPTRMSIAKEDISYLRALQPSQEYKNQRLIGVGGMTLVLTGTVTTIVSAFVKDKSNREGILIAGLAQIGVGLGITLNTSFRKSKKYRRYSFKRSGKDNFWSIQ